MNQYPLIHEKELTPEQAEIKRRMQLVSSTRAKQMLISIQAMQESQAITEAEKLSTNMLDLMKAVRYGDHNGE